VPSSSRVSRAGIRNSFSEVRLILHQVMTTV
jgi:hypothetical protein